MRENTQTAIYRWRMVRMGKYCRGFPHRQKAASQRGGRYSCQADFFRSAGRSALSAPLVASCAWYCRPSGTPISGSNHSETEGEETPSARAIAALVPKYLSRSCAVMPASVGLPTNKVKNKMGVFYYIYFGLPIDFNCRLSDTTHIASTPQQNARAANRNQARESRGCPGERSGEPLRQVVQSKAGSWDSHCAGQPVA